MVFLEGFLVNRKARRRGHGQRGQSPFGFGGDHARRRHVDDLKAT
jgi:hypothetical protein